MRVAKSLLVVGMCLLLIAGTFPETKTMSANQTFDAAWMNRTVLCTAGSGADVTATLPAASSYTNQIALLKKVDAGTAACVLARAGGNTIDGLTSISLAGQWQYVAVVSDGTNWFIKRQGLGADAVLVTPSSTAALTNKTYDVEGAGNSLTTVSYVTFGAAVCQGTTAGGFGSQPATNAPTAICVTGASAGDVTATTAVSNYGVLSFAENGTNVTSQSVQDHFPLPPDWSGNIDLDVRWRTSATSGDVVFRIQTACVADAETGAPTFNAAQSMAADTAKGTTLQWNDVATLTTVTVTGCAAGEELFFRFWRDATVGGDTLAATAEVVWIRFKLRRAQ